MVSRQHTAGGRSMPRMRLSEVAAAAGVSAMTVSRVMNGRAGVAPATRHRVERALLAHELAYAPVVRPTGRTGLVTLLVRSLDSQPAMEMLRGVERHLERIGTRVVLSEMVADQPSDREREWLTALIDGSTDGVILVNPGPDSAVFGMLQHQAIPAIALDVDGTLGQDITAVGATCWTGGRAAVDYLLTLGHRRIAILTEPGAMRCGQERLASYTAALAAAGVPLDPDLIRQDQVTEQTGYVQTSALLALADPPTAVLAGSDEQAAGIYRVAYERGLSIPGAISVIGFDDLRFSALLSPSLTTIRRPYREMGALASGLLLRLLSGERLEVPRMELATSLVLRASCAPPA